MRAVVVPLLFVANLCAAMSPTVYRCKTGSQVNYSDTPCVGGKVVDVTPTRGVDKMTGQSIKGNDVQREEYRAMVDDATYPLHGMSHKQMNVIRRRQKLSSSSQAQCASLDRQLPVLQAQLAAAIGSAQGKVDVELYRARKLSFDLKC